MPLNSSENQLLQDMLELQPPPPTPIHHRAVYFFESTSSESRGYVVNPTDGRNPVERIRRDRFRRPRLFQFTKKSGGSKQQSLFDVTARKCVFQDGERASLGCTREQIEADENVLNGTYVIQTPAEPTTRVVQYDPTFLMEKIRNIDAKPQILRLLKVASRGNFLSQEIPKLSSSHYATWLNPTNRWFSLSMYLASRFEVALWTSFRDKRRTSSLVKIPWMDFDLSEKTLLLAVRQSIAAAIVQEVLEHDRLQNLANLRESKLWCLLENKGMSAFISTTRKEQENEMPSVKHLLRHLVFCHLTDVGSHTDKLRQTVTGLLQVKLAEEVEKSLLEDLQEDGLPPSMETRILKKKFKRKQKAKQKKSVEPIDAHRAPKEAETENETSNSDQDDMIDLVLQRVSQEQKVEFPANKTSSRDRNRNTVLALSVLDAVLNQVYRIVGLQQFNDEELDYEDVNGAFSEVREGEKHQVHLSLKNVSKQGLQVLNEECAEAEDEFIILPEAKKSDKSRDELLSKHDFSSSDQQNRSTMEGMTDSDDQRTQRDPFFAMTGNESIHALDLSRESIQHGDE